jgi:hypothetical protein
MLRLASCVMLWTLGRSHKMQRSAQRDSDFAQASMRCGQLHSWRKQRTAESLWRIIGIETAREWSVLESTVRTGFDPKQPLVIDRNLRLEINPLLDGVDAVIEVDRELKG